MFDWNDLRYFLAVAREGSTGAAARALRVDQSTVHRRLAALEKSIGCVLVERQLTGYRLTKNGEALLENARAVENAVDGLQRRRLTLDDKTVGHVRVTSLVTVGHRILRSGLVDRFHAAHPGITVEMIMGQRVLDLAKGEAEIAIRGGGPGNGALIGKKIAELPWGIYANRTFIKRHGKPAGENDLDRFMLITFVDEIEDLPAARWLRSRAPRARVAARCSNIPSVHLAVKSGAGLAALPAVHAADDRDLVCVLGPIPELNYPMFLYAHKELRRLPRVGTVFDFLQRELKPVLLGVPRRS